MWKKYVLFMFFATRKNKSKSKKKRIERGVRWVVWRFLVSQALMMHAVYLKMFFFF